jgi:hypothetical protein
VYAQARPIECGPLAEDADEVNEFLNNIVGDLRPRDHVEAELAHKISRMCLRDRRLGALEDSLLSDAARSSSPWIETNASSMRKRIDLVEALGEWIAAERTPESTASDSDSGGDALAPVGEASRARPSREELARFLQSDGKGIAWSGSWAKGQPTPRSDAEWDQEIRSLLSDIFPTLDEAAMQLSAFCQRKLDAIPAAVASENHQSSTISLDVFDRMQGMTSRLSREQERALVTYALLQQRVLNSDET